MKTIFGIFTVLLLFSTNGLASNINLPETVDLEKTIVKTNEKESEQLKLDDCSLTASGTVMMGDGTTLQLTITDEGPCDASLAQIMRKTIAKVREAITQN